MSEIKGSEDDLKDALNVAQLEKINLEIESLKRSKGAAGLAHYLPLLTTLLAVAGFLFGIYQYKIQHDERLRAENMAKEREFKKALWERQLTYYLEAAKAASTLASFNEDDGTDIQSERTKARIRFWQLYYGELAVIEDRNVSTALKNYGRCLREYEFLNKKCDQNELKERARALAQECRNAVAKSWDEPLGPLDRSLE
jgi:hypothetical protein